MNSSPQWDEATLTRLQDFIRRGVPLSHIAQQEFGVTAGRLYAVRKKYLDWTPADDLIAKAKKTERRPGFTTQSVASLLDVPLATVYELRQSGALPFVDMRGEGSKRAWWRLSHDDFLTFLNDGAYFHLWKPRSHGWLNIKEVALRLGTTTRKVGRRVAEGSLKARGSGRSMMLHESQFQSQVAVEPGIRATG
jgi:hypothetical protein